MKRFLPAGGGGEPSSSSSSGLHGELAGSKAAAGLRFGRGEISLGHGHDLHNQFHSGGGKAEMKDGADMLARHSSSPAGFFSNLMVADNASFPGSKAGAAGGGAETHHPHHPSMANNASSRKMKSQLSFTAGPQAGAAYHSQISKGGASLFPGADRAAVHPGEKAAGPQAGAAYLSQISKGGASLFPGADRAAVHPGEKAAVPRSFTAGGGGGFSIVGPWDEPRDIVATLGGYEFSGMASSSTLEMAGLDKYTQLQQDQVPFKVRAKRGCATHPRSIAERERRTRISEKLRKLQELVPNMDKQTSTSDMLDLAVEHIKGLQSQLQAMKHEQEKCTCCRKP